LSDTDQGNDASLFREALDTPTLEKFENPQLSEPTPEPKPPEPPPPQPPPDPQPDAAVPSGRFREESEARRKAEREANDLKVRLAAYEATRQQQPPTQQPKLDVFDNPSAFVRQEIMPLIEELRQENRKSAEIMSQNFANAMYGVENVQSAYQTLAQGMHAGDPTVKAVYDQAMISGDPFGIITRWHLERQMLNEVLRNGGDLTAYREKAFQDALKDPEKLKLALEAAKGQAVQQVNRPVTQSQVPYTPSLSDMGATGGDEANTNPSDEALFRQAVSEKRRR